MEKLYYYLSQVFLFFIYRDNYEAERVRHVEFLSHDDPHIYHGLPYEYDENMKKIHHDDHH